MEFVDKIVAFVQWIISIAGINKNARLGFFFFFTKESERKIMREERCVFLHIITIDCTNVAVVGPAVVICVRPLYDKYINGIM